MGNGQLRAGHYVHIGRVDLATEFFSSLPVPVGLDLRPADLHPAHRTHVGHVIGMRPDGLDGPCFPGEQQIECLVKLPHGGLGPLHVVFSRPCVGHRHERNGCHNQQCHDESIAHDGCLREVEGFVAPSIEDSPATMLAGGVQTSTLRALAGLRPRRPSHSGRGGGLDDLPTGPGTPSRPCAPATE